jgi:hypothetical protein
MPTIRLIQLAVDRLAPPATGRIVYWDRHLPGFGMRVTARGAKSWVAMYRVNGKTIMETIAPLARLPKVDDARQLARDSMGKAAAGDNPVVEKRVKAARSEANTVAAAVARYLAECDRNLKPKTAVRATAERRCRASARRKPGSTPRWAWSIGCCATFAGRQQPAWRGSGSRRTSPTRC